MTGWQWFWTLVGFLAYIIVLIFLFFYEPFRVLFDLVINGMRLPSHTVWSGPAPSQAFTLFVAWLLAWLPHGIIGIGFVAAGDNQPSIQVYRNWASEWPGLVRLCVNAAILFGHFALGILGFVLTGRGLVRASSAGVSA